MKLLFALPLLVTLTACSGVTTQPPPSPTAFPAVISQLDMAVDAQHAQVEVHLSVKSAFPRTLKTLRVYLSIHDQRGTQIGIEEAVEILGPITNGQSIGPLEKVTAIRDDRATCVDVTRVEAVMMDYATRVVSGPEARALVTDPGYRGCAGRAR